MMFPETHAKTASVNTIIAEEPAAKPSTPSVRFAPFETPVTIKTVMKIVQIIILRILVIETVQMNLTISISEVQLKSVIITLML